MRYLFLGFIYLFTSFLNASLFPACCFRQRIYIAQAFVNVVFNETLPHLCLQFDLFSVNYGFIWRSLLFF